MEKFCWWGGGVSLTATLGVIIAKAQVSPDIWYGWILREPHVVPVLVVTMIAFWAVALGQHGPVNRVYRRAFTFLFGRGHEIATQQQSLGLSINSARWYCTVFPDEANEDVTRVIQGKVIGNRLQVHAHGNVLGDVCDKHKRAGYEVGHPKSLEVELSNGLHATATHDEWLTVEGIRRWPPHHGPEPPATHSETDSLWKQQAEQWKDKWENERGGSSARDEIIKQLTQERDSVAAERDTAITNCDATKRLLKDSQDNEAAARAHYDRRQAQCFAVMQIWALVNQARTIRRLWPDSDFSKRPLFRASWIPSYSDKKPQEWLGEAIKWHDQVVQFKPLNFSSNQPLLHSLDFDEAMEFLEDGISGVLELLNWRYRVESGMPEVMLTRWDAQKANESSLFGFFIRNQGGIATNISIQSSSFDE